MKTALAGRLWLEICRDVLPVPPAGALVALIGGGGKSGLLVQWAQELWATGRPALMATSTKNFRPPWPVEAIAPANTEGEALAVAARALAGENLFLAGPDSRPEEDKWGAVPKAWLTEAARRHPKLTLLVEADGARGRPFKFHAAHEPVIPEGANLVVAVVGLGLLGRPAGEVIHRPELAPPPFSAPEMVTIPLLAAWLTAPGGYLDFLNPGLLFFNQVETPLSQEAAGDLALLMKLKFPAIPIVAGSLREKRFYRL